jgi:hypothetical protein
MRILKALLYAVGALIALLVLVGLFLPRSAHVERSIETSADAATVYALADGFARFNEWSPWASIDPATKYAYSGPQHGVGARLEWTSDNPDVGNGSQEIVAAEPGQRVTSRLVFGEQTPATMNLTLAPVAAGTQITWSFDADFGWNLLGRYFGLMFDRYIGADFERGLARLKAVAEADAARATTPAPAATDQPADAAASPTGQETPVPPNPQ